MVVRVEQIVKADRLAVMLFAYQWLVKSKNVKIKCKKVRQLAPAA